MSDQHEFAQEGLAVEKHRQQRARRGFSHQDCGKILPNMLGTYVGEHHRRHAAHVLDCVVSHNAGWTEFELHAATPASNKQMRAEALRYVEVPLDVDGLGAIQGKEKTCSRSSIALTFVDCKVAKFTATFAGRQTGAQGNGLLDHDKPKPKSKFVFPKQGFFEKGKSEKEKG